jgi:tRNA G18 (ribose-2'-O)-methylase SpoU
VDYRRLVIFRKKISRDILLQQQNRYYFKLSEYVLIKNISSFENSYYKNLKKLENSREIKKQNKALIAGKKIINDYIQNKVKNILSIIFTKNVSEDELFKYYETLIRKEKDLKVDYVYIQSELLQSLELNQYPPPYLEVKVNPIKSVEDFSFKDSFIVLPLQDPVNMGACIRSAYAFGINNILLTKESCNPYLLKAVRSSAGTVFNCNFYELSYQYPSDILEKSKIPIYVLDLKGKDIRTIKKIPQTFGLILGEEGKGIPENLIPKNAEKIFIPINPSLDSLNVSVACGIALFYLSKNN